MDTLTAPLLLFIIFTGTIYYVLVPFLSEGILVVDEAIDMRTTALELRKMNIYKQIREIEFEREMGLTNQEDFERSREDLVTEAADVLRDIEGLSPTSPDSEEPPVPLLVTSNCPSCQTLIEHGTRFCTHCGTQLGSSCPQCGVATSSDDRFCTNCGRGLLN
ncbi:MAG: zinc ribbon domain-containing protein [Candidatus Marinimicrobia bacterium]|nr:zinc ribbon domain-containing protein [Candidatus Neomarinimicrobiota bacterium]